MKKAREYRINHQTCTNLPVRNDLKCITKHISDRPKKEKSSSSDPMKRSSCQSSSAVDECAPPNAVVAAPSSFDANPPRTSGVSGDWQLRNLEKKTIQHQKLQKTNDVFAKWSSGKITFLKTSSKVWWDTGHLTNPMNIWVWLAAWIYKKDIHVYSQRN